MVQTSYAAVLIAAVALNAATSSLANPHTEGEIDIRAATKSKPSTSRRVSHAAHMYGPSILENGLPLLGQLWGSHQSAPPTQGAEPAQRNYDPIYDLVSRAVTHHQSKASPPAGHAAHKPTHSLSHAAHMYGPSILEQGLPLLGQLLGSHHSKSAPAPAPAPVDDQALGADDQGALQRRIEATPFHSHLRLGLAAGRHSSAHGPARLGAEHFELAHGPAPTPEQGATPGAVSGREFDDELMEREHFDHHEHEETEETDGEFDDEEYDDDDDEESYHGHFHSHSHPYKHMERLD